MKERLTAPQAARALARGARRAGARVVLLPLADGGQGTTDCLVAAAGGKIQNVPAAGPLGDPVAARLGLLADGRTAVLEMASASGLALLVPERRDPLRTTTRGTGDLLLAALDAGAESILMGIGDSATCDAGAGMAQALGIALLDSGGRPIGPGAEGLERLARIDLAGRDPRLPRTEIAVACDVDNPLLGPRGAARVFAPQKGADAEAVERIERALARFADVAERDLGVNVRAIPGGGAAGGLGAGAVALLGARLRPGAECVLDALAVDARLAEADLVLTAEGRLDGQSLGGKATVAIARRARAAGVPCAVIPGSVGPGYEAARSRRAGITAVFPLVREGVTLADAMARAETLLEDRAEEAVRQLGGGRSRRAETETR